MVNLKSQLSGSSSSSSSSRRRDVVPGIFKSCWCGATIVQKIYGSEDNPYRLYFRCAFAASNKLCDDLLVFKWVDQAYLNEIEMLDYQVFVLEEEVRGLKSGCRVSGEEIQKQFDEIKKDFEKYKMEVFEIVEGVLVEENKYLKNYMAMVFVGCMILVVLGLFLSK